MGPDPGFPEQRQRHGPGGRHQLAHPGVKRRRLEGGPVPLAPSEKEAYPAGAEPDELGPGDEAGQSLLDLAAAHETAREIAALAGGPGAGLDDEIRGPGQSSPPQGDGFERIGGVPGGPAEGLSEILPEGVHGRPPNGPGG